ncbi:hypothetical protein BCR43DRAFT_485566, partial [Syncephalastrum racemosum]
MKPIGKGELTDSQAQRHNRKAIGALPASQEISVSTLHLRKKPQPRVSYSSPTSSSAMSMDPGNQLVFLREMEQAKDELSRFRNEIDGLAEQMNGIETDIVRGTFRRSGDRVLEIEENLIEAQESNVNIQVRLENAVIRQKESDTFATRTIRHMHTNLATVARENSHLHGRLAMLAAHQQNHQGSVDATVERIREYLRMLEQAQGAIHSLKGVATTATTVASTTGGGEERAPAVAVQQMPSPAASLEDPQADPLLLSPSLASTTSTSTTTTATSISTTASSSTYTTTPSTTKATAPPSPPPSSSIPPSQIPTHFTPLAKRSDGSRIMIVKPLHGVGHIVSPDVAELYRHRIIRKHGVSTRRQPYAPPSHPKSQQSKQEGLRILL